MYVNKELSWITKFSRWEFECKFPREVNDLFSCIPLSLSFQFSAIAVLRWSTLAPKTNSTNKPRSAWWRSFLRPSRKNLKKTAGKWQVRSHKTADTTASWKFSTREFTLTVASITPVCNHAEGHRHKFILAVCNRVFDARRARNTRKNLGTIWCYHASIYDAKRPCSFSLDDAHWV